MKKVLSFYSSKKKQYCKRNGIIEKAVSACQNVGDFDECFRDGENSSQMERKKKDMKKFYVKLIMIKIY